MNQLEISGVSDKKEIIKRINKFRLENKDNWYQVSVQYGDIFTYQLKVWDTWVQIGRKVFTDTGEVAHNYPSEMELNVGEFKSYLDRFIQK